MDTKNLTDLNPATLAALAKTSADAAKATRSELEPGDYIVDTIVTLVLGAEVKVLEDQTGVSTPQKAKPWGIIHLLLTELNKLREAAGLAGIDLAKVVAMAEAVDAGLIPRHHSTWVDVELGELVSWETKVYPTDSDDTLVFHVMFKRLPPGTVLQPLPKFLQQNGF